VTSEGTGQTSEVDRQRFGQRSAISKSLSRLDRLASHPLLALVVLMASATWLIVNAIIGFPSQPARIFQTVVGAVTLAMVFVIQHTQSRQQSATQRKLDEILRALPDADNALITLEHASDSELRATGDSHEAIRRAAIDDDHPQTGD
jgi:low affinity Fe/Cu permease